MLDAVFSCALRISTFGRLLDISRLAGIVAGLGLRGRLYSGLRTFKIHLLSGTGRVQPKECSSRSFPETWAGRALTGGPAW